MIKTRLLSKRFATCVLESLRKLRRSVGAVHKIYVLILTYFVNMQINVDKTILPHMHSRNAEVVIMIVKACVVDRRPSVRGHDADAGDARLFSQKPFFQ